MTSEQKDLLYNVFYFKSLTVPQAQKLLYANDDTISREKRLYQIFNSLRYMGLIEIAKPLPSYCQHRTHYLSEEGLNYIQTNLNIKPNNFGNGWRNLKMDYHKIEWCYFSYTDYLKFLNSYKHHHQNINELINLYQLGITFRGPEYTFIGNDLDIKVDQVLYSLNIAVKYSSTEALLRQFEKYKTYLEIRPNAIDYVVFLYSSNNDDEINTQKISVTLAFKSIFKVTEKPYLEHLDMNSSFPNRFIK